jgi:hypothetical protein
MLLLIKSTCILTLYGFQFIKMCSKFITFLYFLIILHVHIFFNSNTNVFTVRDFYCKRNEASDIFSLHSEVRPSNTPLVIGA